MIGISENPDLDFISGKFFDYTLPKELRYLQKYFKSEVQMQFLRYYILFGHTTRFVDHTGHAVSRRWLKKLKVKFISITESHQQAKKDFDLTKVAKIESGKYKVKDVVMEIKGQRYGY